MRSVTCFVALAAGALILSDAPAAAAGDPSSAPPPPKTAPATAPAQGASSLPPPVPLKERSAADLLSTTNDVVEPGIELLQRAARVTPTEQMARQTEMYFTVKKHAIDGVDAAVDVWNGDYRGAIDTVGGAVVDECIDRAIDAACAYATGTTLVAGAAGCVAVKVARLCHETWTNESWGEKAFKASGASDVIGAFVDEKVREYQAAKASQRSSIEGTRLSNESHAAAVAAMQPAPYSPSTTPSDYGGAALVGALMTGIATFNATSMPSPSSSPAAPSRPSPPPPPPCNPPPGGVCTAQ